MATEIIQINPETFSFQEYSPQETSLITSIEVTTYLNTGSYIESFIYNLNSTIIEADYNFNNYTILNDGQSPGTNGNIVTIDINVEEYINSIQGGPGSGQYITYFNFLQKEIGSNLQQLYISEISSDRTEVRLDSTSLTLLDILEQASNLIQKREDSPYFLDFYLNFGGNQLAIANNIQLDNQDPANPTILIKLYEALPEEFDINSTLWVVTLIEESIAYQVNFSEEPIFVIDTVPLNGPNFNISLKDQINNSTISLSYLDLVNTSLTSSQLQLNSLLEEKEIDINIDYSKFSNFIHFSSAETRLQNFYNKIVLLEQYNSSINSINSTSLNTSTSSSLAYYENLINNLIQNFDGYEYYLYYSSGSVTYPKLTLEPPYLLYSTTSSQALTWLGSTNEASPYYGGLLLSASIFDNGNKDNLLFTIPEYLRDDPQNQPYELFIEMVAQHYDNIWIYYKDVTEKYNADNRLEYGISKDIVADAIRDFGIKLYQNNFSTSDLYTAFLGLTPEGSLFPFPNITGSLPTPSGFEYIDTLISASNDYIPLDDVNKSLYKRIYHNLPYLLKAKGTLPGLRTLITSYGIPDTILKINEYGGKDRVDLNDWDYWENTFNYAFFTTGSNFVQATWAPINGSWGTLDGVADSVSFRFKTKGLPFNTASIEFQSLWNVDDNRSHLVLRYEGTGYTSGSYPGSIPDPYNQYAYLDFYPSYNNDPTISASIYLPFYDGGWWSVMINRSPEIAGNSDFTLYTGNKIYEGGDNGTALGFYATSSANADTVEWVSFGTSYFAKGGVLVNGNSYTPFSGSLQEVRYFTSPLSENVFKDYIMNPHSTEGDYLNTSPNELIFRAPLGGELYTGSVSIHPKVTGSWITTSSFTFDSDFSFGTIPVFVPNTEYFFYDQVAAGIKNAVSDKIRIEDGIYPFGNTLSPFRSLSQNLAVSQSYTANTNLLEVAFSPQDEVNQDIMDQIGYFNIGEFIGDPRLRSSSATNYPALDALRNEYFEKYIKNYDLVDFIRLIKFFDNSLFKMIKDFVPARTSLASGIIVKQHLLERNKYPQPQVNNYSTIAYYTSGSQNPSGSQNNVPFTFQNIIVSGTLAPQWNNYQPGTVENFSGGTGGTMDMFNGLSTSPSGTLGTGPNNIFFITQSWIDNTITPLGSVAVLHEAQDEFYDGEFSGSYIEITDGELNSNNPYKIPNTQSIFYNTTSSLSNTSTGTINWSYAIGYNGINYSLYVNQLFISEISSNGVNIETALSNLTAGDTITFNIFGDVAGTSFDTNVVTGLITSITAVSPSVWSISLSINPNSQATFFYNYPPPFQQVNPDQFSNSSVILTPYLNNSPNFYYSDFNPIMNNINVNRLSTRFEEVEYYPGITTPTNFDLIISGSALKAAVQDSNYSSKRITNPRYNGVKSTSQFLNKWTSGDEGTYGKTPTVESLKTAVAYCSNISGWPPERENASAIDVQYLIKSDGSIVIPDISQFSLFENKGNFETNEKILISSKTISSGQPQQFRNIIRGGSRIEPILYTQYGNAPNITWNTTMSFSNITVPTTLASTNYQALFNLTSDSAFFDANDVFRNINFTNAIFGGSYLNSGTGTINGYEVSPQAALDGVSLTFQPLVILEFKTTGPLPALYQSLYNTIGVNYTVTLLLLKDNGGNGVFTSVAYQIFDNQIKQSGDVGTYTLNYSTPNINANDIYKIQVRVKETTLLVQGSFKIKQATKFTINQYPIFSTTITPGINSIWQYYNSSSYPYVITSSVSSLIQAYGNPDVKMNDLAGSGFNPISLPWSIEYGDEFKFEGREDFVYQVGKIFGPGDSGSGRLTQTGSIEVHFNLNLPVSASSSNFNLDHFLIRRYVDDPSQIIMEGFKPINSSGPYIVRPEYVVPELDKSIDEFILILTEKGLI